MRNVIREMFFALVVMVVIVGAQQAVAAKSRFVDVGEIGWHMKRPWTDCTEDHSSRWWSMWTLCIYQWED